MLIPSPSQGKGSITQVMIQGEAEGFTDERNATGERPEILKDVLWNS
jgi:hypothetical protein